MSEHFDVVLQAIIEDPGVDDAEGAAVALPNADEWADSLSQLDFGRTIMKELSDDSASDNGYVKRFVEKLDASA